MLLVGEGIVRFAFRHITTTADNRGYFAERWVNEHVRLNSLGFRDRELGAKRADTYRIAVVGDSLAYGQGIAVEARFSNRLEADLNQLRQVFEVFNFSQPGAHTVDQVQFLEQAVLRTEPDFVLLQWHPNDYEGRDLSGRPKRAPLWPHWTRHRLLKASALYYLMEQQWGRLQESLGFVERYDTYMLRRFGDPGGLESTRYQATLKDFMALSTGRGIPLGIVLFPSFGPDPYPFDYLHDRVLELCRGENIDCLDLRAAFGAAEVPKEALRLSRFDNHPSSLANRLAATAILRAFGPVWLATAPNPPQIP